MVITEAAEQAFRAHALSVYPREACGVIAAGSYVPCENAAASPGEHFVIRAQELALIGATIGKVEALLHSHPFDSRRPPKWPASWPSHHDMAQWMKGSTPWGIAATEGENVDPLIWLDEATIAPLEGRPFVHGVWDCYAVVRDWYRLERGITLPNYPRAMEWWERGQDHYAQNFASAGFVEVPRAQSQVGDVCLMQVRSPVINHAAVVTGTNDILHHLFHRLSGSDSFSRWERMCVKIVRYVGAPDA